MYVTLVSTMFSFISSLGLGFPQIDKKEELERATMDEYELIGSKYLLMMLSMIIFLSIFLFMLKHFYNYNIAPKG